MKSKYLDGVPDRGFQSSKYPASLDECSIDGCHGEISVQISCFRKPNGYMVVGWYDDLNHDGNTFMHYIARCGKCYERDIHGSGKAQMQQPGSLPREEA